MRTKSKLSFCIFLILFFNMPLFSADKETAKWTIAIEQFDFVHKKDTLSEDGLETGMTETIPQLIIEKLDANLVRAINPDEKLERKKYELKNERLSLFLQLSGLVKTRDALVLYDYSPSELAYKQKEQDKKIKEIQKKISENLKTLAKEEQEAEKNFLQIEKEKNTKQTGFRKLIKFSKNFFTNSNNLYTREKVIFYTGDGSGLYKPSEELSSKSFTSFEYEKEMVNASINNLITGKINKIGEYFSISIEAYVYPGAKKIASITEVGSTAELEMICTNVARELIPLISNSVPVEININIANEEIKKDDISFFIDDVLQDSIPENMTVSSGVHFIQFVCPGYRSAGTNYNFEGNAIYNIEIDFKEEIQKSLVIRSVKPLVGNFSANGLMEEERQDNISRIKIDDKLVLGEFLSEDGGTAFFYIPQKLVIDNINLSVNVKPFDRGKYVENRRKAMYVSYSALMLSLIPSFYCYGNFAEYASFYNKGYGNYTTGKSWQNAAYISAGISVGCGAFFAYELIRYIIAANSIIPKKARVTSSREIQKEEDLRNLLKEMEVNQTVEIVDETEVSDDIENE